MIPLRRTPPYDGSEPYIFFSYAHRNGDAAQPIIARLTEAGYRVWYDEGIDPGTEWDENIAAHVEGCSFFLALISRAYLASDNCKDELNYARDLNKQRVLVYLEQVELPGGMRMRLSRIQAVHKYGYQDESAFYEKLFSAQGIDACLGEAQASASGSDEPQPERKALVDFLTPADEPYAFPALALLREPTPRPAAEDAETAAQAQQLVKLLQAFKVPATIHHITRGPAVTRYALSLEPGIRLTTLTALQDHIACELNVMKVRIEAPIPGTMLAGIEVPNKQRTTVSLRGLLESREMQKAAQPLTVPLGLNTNGKTVVCDLEKLPHLLMAGTTGSGKSVCIQTMLCSLLYRCSPEELRLLLIDSKDIEYGCYHGIPHLLRPVVSDPQEAADVLDETITEMLRRYQLFKDAGVRNFKAYNDKAERKLPRIVIVIDDLADLMLICKHEVEERICRLTQLAKGAGIHLIAATQSPTINVLTGMIRANIPSRIAFRVPAAEQSRMILDRVGAETLLGYGDMLYMPAGAFAPERVQGCFISEDEVRAVTDFLREGSARDIPARPIPQAELLRVLEEKGAMVNEQQAPLHQAIDLAVEDGRISTSLLQRRLKLGYGRAASLVEEMERLGVIGPMDGAKPRRCLITPRELTELRKQGKLP